jgi:hypothetical protein
MMKTVFRIEVFGGPWDGMDITIPHFSLAEKQMLRLPASPLGACPGVAQSSMSKEARGSAYVMTHKRCVRETAVATVYMKFAFLALEPSGSEAPNRRTSGSQRRQPTSLARHLYRWCHTIRHWMLAPVEYPLAVRNRL